ncbi:MAG: CHAD domain-containing protein [Chloroflexi bacterium]|nr:CHAD domain-containing protein [Chloroflexota bacterium]
MATEVESRYIVPDRILFRRLLQLRRIGPYRLLSSGTVKVVDDYLDTRGKALLRQGWACRLRSQDDAWAVQLKGPGETQDAIMSRPEFEMTLQERIADAANWPPGPLRDRVLDLAGGLALRRLLRIRQTRHQFLLLQGERQVAHVSLDVVRTSGRGVRYKTFMIECELAADGQMDDLQRVDRILAEEYALIPEPLSKLQRALELIQSGRPPDETIAQYSRPATLEALLQRYGVNRARAEAVAEMARQLFVGLAPWHGLPDSTVELLHAAALVPSLGEAGDSANRHLIARDILLRQPIEGLGEEERRSLAAAAYLCSDAVTEERIAEVLPLTMPEEARRRALAIASLVRLATALTDNTQPSSIQAFQETAHGPMIILVGPSAQQDADRARKHSDLWEMALDTPLQWRARVQPVGRPMPTDGPILYIDDSMGEAARKILAYHFEQMRSHQEGTLLGRDPEELHDMRVATRRMRSALRLFGPYIHGPHLRETNEGLRTLAAVLGEVRDLDVALENVKAFASGLPGEQAKTLQPLWRSLRARRRTPRRRLRSFLRSRSYLTLIEEMDSLLARLEREAQTADTVHSVSNVAPRLAYLSWERVLAYDSVLKGAPIELLHALRIDCKQLRYALEFLASVLPEDIVALIPDTKGMQDHLGELHDAAVAIEMLDAFLATAEVPGEIMEQKPSGDELEGVRMYRAECERVLLERLETFPELWKRLTRKRIRRQFRSLVSKGN